MFDPETSVFPARLDGLSFYCEGFPGQSATLERAADGQVSVGAYSPGIVGALARAYPEICRLGGLPSPVARRSLLADLLEDQPSEVSYLHGTIPWGPGGQSTLRWWLYYTECRFDDGFGEHFPDGRETQTPEGA